MDWTNMMQSLQQNQQMQPAGGLQRPQMQPQPMQQGPMNPQMQQNLQRYIQQAQQQGPMQGQGQGPIGPSPNVFQRMMPPMRMMPKGGGGNYHPQNGGVMRPNMGGYMKQMQQRQPMQPRPQMQGPDPRVQQMQARMQQMPQGRMY